MSTILWITGVLPIASKPSILQSQVALHHSLLPSVMLTLRGIAMNDEELPVIINRNPTLLM